MNEYIYMQSNGTDHKITTSDTANLAVAKITLRFIYLLESFTELTENHHIHTYSLLQ